MKRRLLWELRVRRERGSLEAGRAKGRPDPEWFLDMPALLPGEELYVEAFWTLRTEVSASAQVISPIPWSACMRYGMFELNWTEARMLRILWRMVSALDAGYGEYMKNEHARHVRRNSKGTVRKGGKIVERRGQEYGR